MRALENSSSTHREIFFALVAAVEAILADGDALAKAAYRTLRPFRPEVLFQIGARRLLIREHREKFERRNGDFAHDMSLPDARTIAQIGVGVKRVIPKRKAGHQRRRQRQDAIMQTLGRPLSAFSWC